MCAIERLYIIAALHCTAELISFNSIPIASQNIANVYDWTKIGTEARLINTDTAANTFCRAPGEYFDCQTNLAIHCIEGFKNLIA